MIQKEGTPAKSLHLNLAEVGERLHESRALTERQQPAQPAPSAAPAKRVGFETARERPPVPWGPLWARPEWVKRNAAWSILNG